MASIVLGGVGSIVGGPIGGIIGGSIGSMADQMLMNHKSTNKPNIYDLAVIASTFGRPIPLVYGRAKVGGNLIMSSLLQPRQVSSGSGKAGGKGGGKMGGGGKETDYFVNCAVAICRGPIQNLWRVFADSKLIFDQTASPFEGPLWASGLNPEAIPVSKYDTVGDYGAVITFSQSSVEKGANPVIPSGSGQVYFGTEDQPPDPNMQALATGTYGANELVPAYRGVAYVVFNNFPLKTFGNRVPSFTFEVNGAQPGDTTGNMVQVRSIVEDVLQKEGLAPPQMDISAITDEIDGYSVTSEASGRVILEPLQEIFLFDLVETNYKITAKYRMAAETSPVMSIKESDLGARVPPSGGPGTNPVPKFTRLRKQNLDLPRRLNVRYKTASGNAYVGDFSFEVGTVYAQRNKGAVEGSANLTYDTNMVFRDNVIEGLASRALHMMYVNKTTYNLSLPLPYIVLDPGDGVTLNWHLLDGTPVSTVVYLQQIEIGADFTIRAVGVTADEGIPIPSPLPPPPSPPPALDGAPAVGDFSDASSGYGGSDLFGKLTTTQTNDGVILAVLSDAAISTGRTPVVSSITSTSGLVFTRISGGNWENAGRGQFQNIEFWGAPAASILTNEEFTINLTDVAQSVIWSASAFSNMNLVAPLDPNAAAAGFNGDGTSATVTLSTDHANDVLLFAAAHGNIGSHYPPDFSVLLLNWFAGGARIAFTVSCKIVSSTQSGLVLQGTDPIEGACLATAFQGLA